MKLMNLQELIETRAQNEARKEVIKTIDAFRNSDSIRFVGDIEVWVDVKPTKDNPGGRFNVKVDSYHYWEAFKNQAIDIRTQQLIKYYSEQVLECVDKLEFLSTEVSNIQENQRG
jgi:hypothetical protein